MLQPLSKSKTADSNDNDGTLHTETTFKKRFTAACKMHDAIYARHWILRFPEAATQFRHESLFIFKPWSTPRIVCFNLMQSKIYETLLVIVVAANCVVLAMEGGKAERPGFTKFTDVFFLTCFVLEMFMKVVALGFVLHPGSYLRHEFGSLEFLCVLMAVVSIIGDNADTLPVAWVKSLRLFSILRSIELFFVIMIVYAGNLKTLAVGAKTVAPTSLLLLTGFAVVLMVLFGPHSVLEGTSIDETSTASIGGSSTANQVEDGVQSLFLAFRLFSLQSYNHVTSFYPRPIATTVAVACCSLGAIAVVYITAFVWGSSRMLDQFEKRRTKNLTKRDDLDLPMLRMYSNPFAVRESLASAGRGKTPNFIVPGDSNEVPYDSDGKHCRIVAKRLVGDQDTKLDNIFKAPLLTRLMAIVVLVNVALMAARHADQPVSLSIVSDTADAIFVAFAFVEMIFSILSMRLKGYLTSRRSLFDFFCFIEGLADIFVFHVGGFSYLRPVNPIRLGKLIKHVPALERSIFAIVDGANTIFMVGFLYFGATVSSMVLFSDGDRRENDNDTQEETNAFSTYGRASVSSFYPILGDRWGELAEYAAFESNQWAYLYYVLLVVLMHYVLTRYFIVTMLPKRLRHRGGNVANGPMDMNDAFSGLTFGFFAEELSDGGGKEIDAEEADESTADFNESGTESESQPTKPAKRTVKKSGTSSGSGGPKVKNGLLIDSDEDELVNDLGETVKTLASGATNALEQAMREAEAELLQEQQQSNPLSTKPSAGESNNHVDDDDDDDMLVTTVGNLDATCRTDFSAYTFTASVPDMCVFSPHQQQQQQPNGQLSSSANFMDYPSSPTLGASPQNSNLFTEVEELDSHEALLQQYQLRQQRLQESSWLQSAVALSFILQVVLMQEIPRASADGHGRIAYSVVVVALLVGQCLWVGLQIKNAKTKRKREERMLFNASSTAHSSFGGKTFSTNNGSSRVNTTTVLMIVEVLLSILCIVQVVVGGFFTYKDGATAPAESTFSVVLRTLYSLRCVTLTPITRRTALTILHGLPHYIPLFVVIVAFLAAGIAFLVDDATQCPLPTTTSTVSGMQQVNISFSQSGGGRIDFASMASIATTAAEGCGYGYTNAGTALRSFSALLVGDNSLGPIYAAVEAKRTGQIIFLIVFQLFFFIVLCRLLCDLVVRYVRINLGEEVAEIVDAIAEFAFKPRAVPPTVRQRDPFFFRFALFRSGVFTRQLLAVAVLVSQIGTIHLKPISLEESPTALLAEGVILLVNALITLPRMLVLGFGGKRQVELRKRGFRLTWLEDGTDLFALLCHAMLIPMAILGEPPKAVYIIFQLRFLHLLRLRDSRYTAVLAKTIRSTLARFLQLAAFFVGSAICFSAILHGAVSEERRTGEHHAVDLTVGSALHLGFGLLIGSGWSEILPTSSAQLQQSWTDENALIITILCVLYILLVIVPIWASAVGICIQHASPMVEAVHITAKSHFAAFLKAWGYMDPTASGVVPITCLPKLLAMSAPPLGTFRHQRFPFIAFNAAADNNHIVSGESEGEHTKLLESLEHLSSSSGASIRFGDLASALAKNVSSEGLGLGHGLEWASIEASLRRRFPDLFEDEQRLRKSRKEKSKKNKENARDEAVDDGVVEEDDEDYELWESMQMSSSTRPTQGGGTALALSMSTSQKDSTSVPPSTNTSPQGSKIRRKTSPDGPAFPAPSLSPGGVNSPLQVAASHDSDSLAQSPSSSILLPPALSPVTAAHSSPQTSPLAPHPQQKQAAKKKATVVVDVAPTNKNNIGTLPGASFCVSHHVAAAEIQRVFRGFNARCQTLRSVEGSPSSSSSLSPRKAKEIGSGLGAKKRSPLNADGTTVVEL